MTFIGKIPRILLHKLPKALMLSLFKGAEYFLRVLALRHTACPSWTVPHLANTSSPTLEDLAREYALFRGKALQIKSWARADRVQSNNNMP